MITSSQAFRLSAVVATMTVLYNMVAPTASIMGQIVAYKTMAFLVPLLT